MFEGLFQFGHAISGFLDPLSIGLILLSSLVGVVIGALPGLTATMGIALMTTLTIKMPSNQALLVLICTYVGAIYGGSRSAILLNIPGTPASAASCLDGHALAKQGLAGRAMGIATSGSVSSAAGFHSGSAPPRSSPSTSTRSTKGRPADRARDGSPWRSRSAPRPHSS